MGNKKLTTALLRTRVRAPHRPYNATPKCRSSRLPSPCWRTPSSPPRASPDGPSPHLLALCHQSMQLTLPTWPPTRTTTPPSPNTPHHPLNTQLRHTQRQFSGDSQRFGAIPGASQTPRAAPHDAGELIALRRPRQDACGAKSERGEAGMIRLPLHIACDIVTPAQHYVSSSGPPPPHHPFILLIAIILDSSSPSLPSLPWRARPTPSRPPPNPAAAVRVPEVPLHPLALPITPLPAASAPAAGFPAAPFPPPFPTPVFLLLSRLWWSFFGFSVKVFCVFGGVFLRFRWVFFGDCFLGWPRRRHALRSASKAQGQLLGHHGEGDYASCCN